jgi:hypothetical protein
MTISSITLHGIDIPVSAVAKLIPTPPALVVSRKIKCSDPGALKASIDF